MVDVVQRVRDSIIENLECSSVYDNRQATPIHFFEIMDLEWLSIHAKPAADRDAAQVFRYHIGSVAIGAFIIAVINNGMNLTGVESHMQKVIYGAVILIAVLVDRLKIHLLKLKKHKLIKNI